MMSFFYFLFLLKKIHPELSVPVFLFSVYGLLLQHGR